MGLFAILGGNPLAENPIGPALINQYDGHQNRSCHCHDTKGVWSGGGIMNGEAPGRIEARDHEPWKEPGKEGQRGGDNRKGT